MVFYSLPYQPLQMVFTVQITGVTVGVNFPALPDHWSCQTWSVVDLMCRHFSATPQFGAPKLQDLNLRLYPDILTIQWRRLKYPDLFYLGRIKMKNEKFPAFLPPPCHTVSYVAQNLFKLSQSLPGSEIRRLLAFFSLSLRFSSSIKIMSVISAALKSRVRRPALFEKVMKPSDTLQYFKDGQYVEQTVQMRDFDSVTDHLK